MSAEEVATERIERICKNNLTITQAINRLDALDLSEFLSEGRSLINIIDAIEEKYDNLFWKTYGYYVFDPLTVEEINDYLTSRYNIWFKPYTDWVVRHDDGTYAKTERRT